EGALLQTACHFRSPPTLLRPATHDVLVGWMLLLAGASLGLAPRADRIPATRGLAFTAAQRMVDGVHRHSAGLGTHALPAGAAGLAELDQLCLGVAHLTDSGPAVERHHPHLARREAKQRHLVFLGHQLHGRT